MLNELEVIRFQSHVYSYVEFHRGLNIIRGTSNYGKSVLVRAIKWATDNEPRGTPFLNWDSDLAEGVEVNMGFDEGAISRIHNEKFNGYDIPDLGEDGKFEALYTDVPEEVRAITRLDESNIRGQDDGYFLLKDSPGKIARKLNDKAGLADIDRVAKITKSLISEFNTKLTVSQADLKKKTERKVVLDKVAQHKDLINKIDVLFRARDNSWSTLTTLTHAIKVVNAIQLSIDKRKKILEAKPQVEALSKLLKRRLKVTAKLTRLRLTFQDISDLLTAISMTKTELERRPLVLDILQLGVERNELVPKWRVLYGLYDSVTGTMKKIAIKRTLITAVQKGLDELRDKIEVCPTCGSEKEHWKHEIGERP